MTSTSIAPSANASLGNDAKTLERITEPGINIAVWERSVAHLDDVLISLLENDISFKATGTADEVLDTLQLTFTQLGLEGSTMLADIRNLLKSYQAIAKADSFRILLSTIHSNMCKRFHTDINSLRMLCTYLGAGTLWVAEPSGGRDNVFAPGEGGPVNPHHDSIRQTTAGDVMILKGALYSNGQPVLHRSPEIEANEGVRLLLRIDTNENPFA